AGMATTTFMGSSANWDGILAAKAIDGLAYLRTLDANRSVLTWVRKGDTRYLRSAAADAYIWNHGDREVSRLAVDSFLRLDERWLRDRFRRYADDKPEQFDLRVEEWFR